MRASRFYILLVLTLLAGADLLVFALNVERIGETPAGAVQAFPLLAEDPGAAARIVIEEADGDIDLARSASASLWLLSDKGGYPAETARVAKLVNDLAGMTLFEAKTAAADRLDFLGLAGPDSGPRVQIFDAAGKPLVDAVIGAWRENLGRVGITGTYVRYSDAEQAWLALGAPVLPKSALAMVNQTLLRLPGSVIARVSVTPPEGGEPLVALRTTRSQQGFSLDPPPSGGVGVNQASLRALVGVLQLLVFDDVTPAEDLPFEQAWTAVFTSFDGIQITLVFTQDQGALWARVSAQAVLPPGGATSSPRQDAVDFAAALAAETDGWAYRLNPQLFSSLAKRRSAITTAPGE